MPTVPASYADSLARSLDHGRQLSAYRIGKSNVRHYSATEKRIDAMPCAIEELVGNHKIQRLVFLLQRPDGGNRNNSLDSKLLEAMDIGAEIQLTGKNPVPAPMPR